MDFRNVTDLFADPAFDGNPVMIKQVKAEEELTDQDINQRKKVGKLLIRKTVSRLILRKGNKEYPIQPEIIQGGSIVSAPQSKFMWQA